LKIAIVTAYNEAYKYLGDLTSANKQEYCDRYGYDFIKSDEISDPRFSFNWVKSLAVNKILDKYDWVMWSDADTLIMNMTIPVTHYIDNQTDKDLIAGLYVVDIERNAGSDYIYNPIELPTFVYHLGNFFIRNTPWSRYVMNRIYQMRDSGIDGLSTNLYDEHALYLMVKENREISTKIKTLPLQALSTLPHDLFDHKTNFPIYTPGEYIIHFLAIPLQDRIDFANEYLKKVIR